MHPEQTLPTSRRLALAIGSRFYANGRMCPHGHVSKYLTKDYNATSATSLRRACKLNGATSGTGRGYVKTKHRTPSAGTRGATSSYRPIGAGTRSCSAATAPPCEPISRACLRRVRHGTTTGAVRIGGIWTTKSRCQSLICIIPLRLLLRRTTPMCSPWSVYLRKSWVMFVPT